jgi:hypothetical protein
MHEITQAQVDEILSEFEGYGFETNENTFRPDYSGRGMHGKECIGFVIHPSGTVALGAALCDALRNLNEPSDDLLYKMLVNAQLDNMAFDVILYFPGVQLKKE